MAVLEHLVVELSGDSAALRSDMQGVSQKMSDIGRDMARVGSRLTATVTAPLVGVAAASFKMAADAEEAANKFDVVMGGSATRVRQRLEELTATIPLTRSEMERMSAGIQDMLVPMGVARDRAADMSAGMVELAGDLGSFNNVPTTQVLEAMQSALAGASEPMRRFGVDTRVTRLEALALEEGLIEEGQQLDNTTTALAVMAAVQRDSTDAIGDAARTTDSATNSVRFLWRDIKQLAITIGQTLMPVITPWIGRLREVVGWFDDLSPGVKSAILVVGGLAAALGPLLVVFGTLITTGGAVIGVLSGFGPAIAAVVAVVGGMTAAWALFDDEIKAVWSAVKPIMQAIMDVQKAVAKVVLTSIDVMVGAAFVAWRKGLEDTWKVWKTVTGFIAKVVKGVAGTVHEFLVDKFEPVVEIVIEMLEMIEGAWAWLKEKVTGETVPRMSRELGGLFERMKRDTTSTTSRTRDTISTEWEGLRSDVTATTGVMETEVTDIYDRMWDAMQAKAVDSRGKIAEHFFQMHQEVLAETEDMVTNTLVNFDELEIEMPATVERTKGEVVGVLDDMDESMVDKTTGMVEGVTNKFAELQGAIEDKLGPLPDAIGGIFDDIASAIELGEKGINVANTIDDWVELAKGIIGALKSIWDWINSDEGKGVVNFLSDVGSGKFGPGGSGSGFGDEPSINIGQTVVDPAFLGAFGVSDALIATLIEIQAVSQRFLDAMQQRMVEMVQQLRTQSGFLNTIVGQLKAFTTAQGGDATQTSAQVDVTATISAASIEMPDTGGVTVANPADDVGADLFPVIRSLHRSAEQQLTQLLTIAGESMNVRMLLGNAVTRLDEILLVLADQATTTTANASMAMAGGGGGGGINVEVNFLAPVTGVSEDSLAGLVAERLGPEIDAALGRRRRTQRSSVGQLRQD